jgi:hypothetical protein
MLTQKQKERRVQWALQHKDDDWSRTVFSDETSYQLFRNMIHRWSKNPQQSSTESRKTSRRSWSGGPLALKDRFRAIRSKGSWIVPTMFKFYKSISFVVQGSNLHDSGGFNKTMIRSTRAG